MSFKELLKAQLSLPSNLANSLPSGFQAIGEVAILSLKPELMPYKRQIGQALLKLFPRFKTCCIKTGVIKGQFRQPQLEVVAGNGTETVHKESSCLFKLDVAKIMWAKGNIKERQRIAQSVKHNETVVDMFAGIGYFTIPIAKHAKAKQIYAFELNPVAFHYLKENLKLNKVEERVVAIKGDCAEEVPKLAQKGRIADRIIMGLLPPPKAYLPAAFSIIKRGGIIHYEDLIKSSQKPALPPEAVTEAAKHGMKVKLINAQKVKSYAPRVDHFTLDIQAV